MLDQFKQTTAKTKSPYTCHNSCSSRSLLAICVWVSIVPEALCIAFPGKDFLILPGESVVTAIWHTGELLLTFRGESDSFCCSLDIALRGHLWLWLVLNSNHATNYSGRMWDRASMFRSSLPWLYNKPPVLMGSTEQWCDLGPTFISSSQYRIPVYGCLFVHAAIFLNWFI